MIKMQDNANVDFIQSVDNHVFFKDRTITKASEHKNVCNEFTHIFYMILIKNTKKDIACSII